MVIFHFELNDLEAVVFGCSEKIIRAIPKHGRGKIYMRISGKVRSIVIYLSAIGLAVIAGLWIGVGPDQNAAPTNAGSKTFRYTDAPTATFPGANFGAIPDAPTGNCWGAFVPTPRNVTFNVSGISGSPNNVEVSTAVTHTWVGDVRATLVAPDTTSFVLFARTGATTSGANGDSSDLSGPYTFKDSAIGPNWWDEAFNRTSTEVLTAGNYRTTGAGGAGQTDPAPVTNLTAAFAGVANPNGTWTLRLEDGCAGDTGSISAATLTLTGGVVAPPQHVVDFNGDGRTDLAVVRNTGGGPMGQMTWFLNTNPGVTPTFGYAWGLSGDFFIPEDFDGDNKSDVAVWRPGAAGSSHFYILQSIGFTLRDDIFGQTGDNPTVVGDYDGDGKADVAVYRAGATAGAQSTWYYRGSLTPANITFVPWGQNGDFPAPGDYDGDGKNDYVIQRNNGGGQAAFWHRLSSGGTLVFAFGTPTDLIVPGDYDGDGKTDVAVVRGIAGNINWYYRKSTDGTIVQSIFGSSATDFATQGDYDGDGKTEPAIWRQSATPGGSAFWYQGSTSGVVSIPFGLIGDYPVANYNVH